MRFISSFVLIVSFVGAMGWQCPSGFELRGEQCFNVQCNTQITSPPPPPRIINPCVMPATRVQPFVPPVVQPVFQPVVQPVFQPVVPPVVQPVFEVNCPAGTYSSNGLCISAKILVICPDGTEARGNTCLVHVQSHETIQVEVRCPPSTYLDRARNVCIYEAQAVSLTIECPPNTDRRGNLCVMRPVAVQFRCSDGTMPVGGFCIVSATGTVDVRCPHGSTRVAHNICQMMPTAPHIKYICPDGRPATDNVCHVSGGGPTPPEKYRCPDTFHMDHDGNCVKRLTSDKPPPKIDFECPRNSSRRGNVCWLDVLGPIPQFKYVCPQGSIQESANTCVYKIPEAHFDISCPYPFEKKGNRCIHTVKTDNCHHSNDIVGSDCEISSAINKGSEPVIYNNNTVHAPTNITSTNIHNISISSNECGNGAKERVIVTNGKTERIPCAAQPPATIRVPQPYPVHVPVPVHVPQPMPMPQQSCCTQQVRQCSSSNSCQYVPQQQCGSVCDSDYESF